ncbi:MAG: hypothetical protein Q4D56_06560 [Bacteroides sp.]|nr:hypothetical protein [Bacteroides sp.]
MLVTEEYRSFVCYTTGQVDDRGWLVFTLARDDHFGRSIPYSEIAGWTYVDAGGEQCTIKKGGAQ